MLRKGPTSLLEVGPFVYSLNHQFTGGYDYYIFDFGEFIAFR